MLQQKTCRCDWERGELSLRGIAVKIFLCDRQENDTKEEKENTVIKRLLYFVHMSELGSLA